MARVCGEAQLCETLNGVNRYDGSMPWAILGRIASIVFTVALWILVGARVMLDLIGYSTAPEDIEVAQIRLAQGIDLLLSAPWWVPWGLAAATTLLLIWLSWDPTRQTSHASAGSTAQASRADQPQPPKDARAAEPALTLIENKKFHNTPRDLDGYYYKNCEFHNVLFRFNGGNYTIDGGSITGKVGITSSNPDINAGYILMYKLQHVKNFVPDNTAIKEDEYGNVEVTVDTTKAPTRDRTPPDGTVGKIEQNPRK